MSNIYLVLDKENDKNYCLVKAKDEDQAFELYCDNVEIDESFIEHVHIKYINMSFAEYFWDLSENWVPDGPLLKSIENHRHKFIKNVKKYFGVNKDYAEIFLKHWETTEHYPDCSLFPIEMIRFIYKKETSFNSDVKHNWCTFEIIDIDKFIRIGFEKDEII